MKNILIISMFFHMVSYAQGRKPIPMIVGEDSIPSYILEEANITVFDAEFQKKYDKSKYYVRQVHSYAMIASAMLNEFQDSLAQIEKKSQKRRYLKEVNRYLKEEFGEEVSDMSVNEGKHLMKIIHKETGLTAYEIINTYRGGMKAVWWQSIVKVFGTTLKYEFDPLGEDDALAKILREVESGKIKVKPRPVKTEKAKESLSKRAKKKLEKQKKKELKNKQKKQHT